jgi:hypothetical protein
MKDKRESGKREYQRPEISSRKLSLGVYGEYGMEDKPRRDGGSGDGHRDWSTF